MIIETRFKCIFFFFGLGAELELLRDFGNDPSEEEETKIAYENEVRTPEIPEGVDKDLDLVKWKQFC